MKWEIQLLKTHGERFKENLLKSYEEYDMSMLPLLKFLLYITLNVCLNLWFQSWLVRYGLNTFLKNTLLTFVVYFLIISLIKLVYLFLAKSEYQLSTNLDELVAYYNKVDVNLLNVIEEKINKKEYLLKDGCVKITKSFYFPIFLDEKRFLKQAIKESKIKNRKRKIKTIIR